MHISLHGKAPDCIELYYLWIQLFICKREIYIFLKSHSLIFKHMNKVASLITFSSVFNTSVNALSTSLNIETLSENSSVLDTNY